MALDYSVIIPIYNEEGSLEPLYRSVKKTMDAIGKEYEVIFVDDGSTDSSVEKLARISPESPVLRVVVLEKRVGQSEALQAGFDAAAGEIYITLDGDGQNDPADIPRLLDKIKEGYDVAHGWRKDRRDPFLKIVASRVAALARRLTTNDKIHDVGCSLRAFRKKDMEGVCLWGGLHRFFATIMIRKGCKIGEVVVSHHPRKQGVTKYGIMGRLMAGTRDLWRVSFTDFNTLMRHPRTYKIKRTIGVKSDSAKNI